MANPIKEEDQYSQHHQQQNPNYNEIPIANDLLDLGITRFIKQGNLVHLYIENNGEKIAFNILPKNFQSTIKRFREAAKGTGILSDRAITDIEKELTNPDKNYIRHLNPEADPSYNGAGGNSQDVVNYATVYEHDSKLYEAVKIGDINCFIEVADPHAVLDKTKKSITEGGHGKAAKVKINSSKKGSQFYQHINIVQEIVLPDTEDGHSNKVLPLPMEQYFSMPYVFKSKEEFVSLLTEVRQCKNLESLYYDVKKQWHLFTQFCDEHKTICSSDVVFSYFQDKLGLTHFLLFVGAGNSGKTTNLFLFKLLAYRNIMSSNIPSADIFSMGGGTTKEGVFTLSDNEVTELEKDPKKMQILRDSYTFGVDTHRVDTTFGRKVTNMKSFGLKVLSMNVLPEGENVETLLQRFLILYCIGKVQKLKVIKVLRPTSKKSIYSKLAEDIRLLRNKLLLYRTLHYFEDIPDVALNVPNRESELFLSIFQLFQNTKNALKEIEIAASKYTNENRKRMEYSLKAVVYRALRHLTKVNKTDEVETMVLWDYLKTVLGGNYVNGTNLSFECINFGTISLRRVLKIVRDDFTAEAIRKHGSDHETIRGWKLNLKQLEEQNFTYNPDCNVKVAITTNNTSKNGSDILRFSGNIKNKNKNKILKSGKSSKHLTQKYQHNGILRNPKISKKNERSDAQ